MPTHQEAVDHLKWAISASNDILAALSAVRQPRLEDYEVDVALGHLARLRNRLESLERRAQIMRGIEMAGLTRRDTA